METRILFKIGPKEVQLTEIAEAEAILSSTDQIQLEMVHKMLKYYSFVTLSGFLCQEKREMYYFVIIKWANILGCRGECILPFSVIRRLSNSVKIYFEYHTVFRAIKFWAI